MLILLVIIFVIGLFALGIWLWHRRTVGNRASTANLLPAAMQQGKSNLTESGVSLEEDVAEGIQESSEDRQGKQILAGEPSDSSQSKTGSSSEAEQTSSSVAVEDDESVSAIDAPAEDSSENMSGAAQTSGRFSARRTGNMQDDAGGQSRACPDHVEDKPAMQKQADCEAEDRNAIDEATSGRVGSGHIFPIESAEDSDAHCASDGELSEDLGVADESEESSGVARHAETESPTSHAPASLEKAQKTAPREDSEADDQTDGEDISVDTPIGERAHPGPIGRSDGIENTDVNHASDAQLGGNDRDLVESKKDGGDGDPAESKAQTIHTLPIREGNAKTEAWSGSEADHKSNSEEVSSTVEENAQNTDPKRKHPAVYRDRRGLRRSVGQKLKSVSSPSPPAEARLRLLLDPIQRSASLSVLLMRPEGFPERVQPLMDGEGPVEAFDSSRYDDLALAWTGDLLVGELRIESNEGQRWLRAARPVHIFTESPTEAGMISVGSARSDVPHVVICKADGEEAVRAAAVLTGSPPLVSHERWRGIPDGWSVLSGYCPRHAASAALATQLSPLDPGTAVEITLTGGLAIRATVYAEGSPPRVGIAPLPDGASVSIGGIPAKQAPDGAWEADGYDGPGHHLIDVVPGPSLTYQIIADPTANGERMFWDAHPERFGTDSHKPWGRAGICGAAVRGPDGETVIAEASLPILIALGEQRQAVPLRPRVDVPASVAIMSEAPCFLVAATGLRRKQGRIVWLGSAAKRAGRFSPDQRWAETVRSIAARRLRLEGADADGERVWWNAKQRARRIRRKR